MQIKTFLFPAIFIACLYSCTSGSSSGKASETGSSSSDTSDAPVETQKPNSDYKPAFAGQTRIKGIHTKTPYLVEKIAEGMERPWAVVPLKDGRLLITLRGGTMQLRSADGALIKDITGFPKVDNDGQGGMLDVAPDPAFEQNRIIYWSFSEPQPTGNLMAVAKGKLSEDFATISDVSIIFRATPALKSNLHFGSRLVFDKDGYLFVSTGERSILEGRAQAPLLTSGLGKIYKITTEGKAAPGNPFLNDPTAIPQIYSYGHRNPQGLAIHPATGDLWECEFGPRGGDEVNLIKPGKNYGWPTITYGIEYSGEKVGEGIQKKEGLEQPIYYWDPVVSPSGIVFYPGDSIPEWKNNLFIAGLSSTHIIRLVIEDNKVTGEEKLLADKKERIRDVAYSNGKLYAITDGGILFRIRRK
jgi:glucose/arabinose dehydrogenase